MGNFGNETVASPDEVRTAIAGLSPEELKDLGSFARLRIQATNRRAHGREVGDLIHDALTLTVAKRRPWRKKVSFVEHLKGCMQSISSGWIEKREGEEISLTQHLDHEMDGNRTSMDVAGPFPNYESELDAEKNVQRVLAAFPNGSLEQKIIEMWLEGFQQREIVRSLRISLSEYKTAAHRIRQSNIVRMLNRQNKASHV